MTAKQPLLTIAIPTWNRSVFLEKTLKQLHQEIGACEPESIELIVSDNCSSDDTQAIVDHAKNMGLNLRYILNKENIGSDANIAQCFNLATGSYVLILGDDDVLVDKALSFLLKRLKIEKYGIICMRAYGFDQDFRQEYPGSFGSEKTFMDAGMFLAAIGPLMTFISACVIHKSLLPKIDAKDFCGENLVQVHLVIRAALEAKENLFIKRYLIACKRNNSGGYDFAKVFVENLGNILDSYRESGLNTKAIAAIETRLLIGYFPFYLLKQRLQNNTDIAMSYQRFLNRYQGRRCFHWWVAPILTLPRIAAILWGGAVTIIGRSIYGDLQRGLYLLFSKIAQRT